MMRQGVRTFSTRRHTGERIRSSTAVVTAIVLSLITARAVTAGEVRTKTITTKYTYNADAALTSFTVQREDGPPPVTTYVTWDDFVPDASDPTTGTVMRGNGTMDGFGPNPGGAAQFEFDARNRLLRYQEPGVDESYSYRADGLMLSSSVHDDTRKFYYDAAGNPQVTNIHQEGADLWSAYLEDVRYLDDGTQQVLLQPRKDVACTYDAQAQSLQSYTYDMFGSQPEKPRRGDYDLHDNPFQYAGEYQDPMWGGVYLRARWYHPDLPIFLSRDRAAHLNRYGYGGGNPVMNVDPSGMSFWHSVGRGLRAANAFLNKGIGGHFARFFLAPVMSGLAIAADPKGFWEQIKTDKNGIDIFLAAGIATEGLSILTERAGLSSFVRNLSLRTRFASRLVIDSGLVIGQSVVAGAEHGFHHFNWESFAQGIELGAGGLVYSRGLVGEGYNPYTLKGTDVAKIAENVTSDKLLIFRERTPLKLKVGITSPFSERVKLSWYHERIVAVSKDYVSTTEVTVDQRVGFVRRTFQGSNVYGRGAPLDLKVYFGESGSRFQFVGELDRTKEITRTFKRSNPRNFPGETAVGAKETGGRRIVPEGKSTYNAFTNNCHYHAQGVLKELGLW